MGSNRFYLEERPEHRANVEGFFIDASPVTNTAFAEFVAETGYVTLAERNTGHLDGAGAVIEAGSLVFRAPSRERLARGSHDWWSYVPGACWRLPEGPNSDIVGRKDHPVVHIAYEDALAYALWAGKALPSEAQWEFAARGGTANAYTWGDEFAPGRSLASIWPNDDFPYLAPTERAGTTPIGSFPPNGFGLFDMIGNVWEWTSDHYAARHGAPVKSCCHNNSARQGMQNIGEPEATTVQKTVKGGSHLCAPNFCQRYRPAARQPQAIDTSTSHIGFRCVKA